MTISLQLRGVSPGQDYDFTLRVLCTYYGTRVRTQCIHYSNTAVSKPSGQRAATVRDHIEITSSPSYRTWDALAATCRRAPNSRLC